MSSGGDASLLPLFLKLAGTGRPGRRCRRGRRAQGDLAPRCRGPGPARRARGHARSCGAWRAKGSSRGRQRPFEETDVEGAWLIVAATGDTAVQRTRRAAAERARVFLVAVDDPPNASAYCGAVVRRPPFLVAISSSGATPALTRLVREIIEQVLPGDAWIDHAKALRAKWIADGTPIGERFASLVRELSERAK